MRISRDEPTTCLFPAALTALEGGNVSAQATDTPPVLLSYQPGAAFFSVRALRDDARAAINVVFRGKVFVLTFLPDAAADRAVSFIDETESVSGHRPVTTADRLRGLIDRAKRHELIAREYPALTQTVERLTPGTHTRYPGFVVTVAEVFRFAAEDTLVLRLDFENTGDAAFRFDPSGLAVRVGPNIFPAARTDAVGFVASHARATAWIAVAGNSDGGSGNLSAHNTFFVLVPRMP
ncbi:MAG: hypothetical protein Q8N18_05100 [Opitutaceae bacterium]|nr:hypothetical protein [Opitutaceae bacterium]